MKLLIWIIYIVVAILLVAMLTNWLITKFEAKRLGGALSNDEFEANMRKAQIIDVREKAPFKQGHILGARNIPFSMFKMTYGEIRSDLPVYLYADQVSLAIRAAKILHKNGYPEVKWLQNGYDKWEGKTKSSKY